MSTSSKKIVVFTATGNQGISVCEYLVNDGYHVIGVTRNLGSENAKALSALGIEVVKGDLDDSASYAPALEGIYGAFVNADFWSRYFSNGKDGHEAGEYEEKQAKTAIEACVQAGAKHIVYSAMDHADFAPQMSHKAKVAQWAISQGYPVTNLYTSYYLSNLLKLGLLKKDDDGTYTLAMAAPDDCVLTSFAVEQTGGWVAGILRDPKKYIGSRVDACSEVITVGAMAKVLSDMSGKTVKTLGIPGGESFLEGSDVKKMGLGDFYLNFLAFYKGLLPRDVAQSKEVYPEQWDTKAWLLQNKEIRALLGL